jgi:hypothetical protein
MGRNKNNPPFPFLELNELPVSVMRLQILLFLKSCMKCSEFHGEDLPKFNAPVVTSSDEGCKECT